MSAPLSSFPAPYFPEAATAPQLAPLPPTATPEGERLRVAYNDQRQLLFVYANGSVGPSHPAYASLHWAYSLSVPPFPQQRMFYGGQLPNGAPTQQHTAQQQAPAAVSNNQAPFGYMQHLYPSPPTAAAPAGFTDPYSVMQQQLRAQQMAMQQQQQQQQMMMQQQHLAAMRQMKQNTQTTPVEQQQKMYQCGPFPAVSSMYPQLQQQAHMPAWGLGTFTPQYLPPPMQTLEQAQLQEMRLQQQQAFLSTVPRRQTEAAQAAPASAVTKEQAKTITAQEQEPLIGQKVLAQVQSFATEPERQAQKAIAAAELAAAEPSSVTPVVAEAVEETKPATAQESIEPRVNFKLTYKEETYRFASTLLDNELFRAVIAKVGSIVEDTDLDVFWNDGDSNIVLETSEDLAAAIDFAKQTRNNHSKPPCVRLFVDENREIEVESVPELTEEVPAVPELVEEITSLSIAAPKLKMEIGETEKALLETMLDFEQTGVVKSPYIINELAHPSNIIPSGSPLDLEIRRLVVQHVSQLTSPVDDVLEYLKNIPRNELAMTVICQWIKSEMDNSVSEEESVDVSPLTIAALQVIAATGEKNSTFLNLLMHSALRAARLSQKNLMEDSVSEKQDKVKIEGDLRRCVNLEAYCIMSTGLKHFVSKETKEKMKAESEAAKVAVAEWIAERSQIQARIAELEQEVQERKEEQARLRKLMVRGDQTDFDAVGAAKVATAALQAATPSAESIEMTTEEHQKCADSDMETAWEMSDEEEEDSEEEEVEESSEDSESESSSDDDEINFAKNEKTDEDEEESSSDEDETEEEDEDEKERKEEQEERVFTTLEAMENTFKTLAEDLAKCTPIECVQPLQSTSETKEEKVDSAEVEKELKIQQKMAELKNVSFWDVMASFEVKMEEIEDKMNDLEERIDDIEETNGEETIESRMIEMEERLEKVEKRIEESKEVVL